MTSVVALTTTFTPAASCLTDIYQRNDTGVYTHSGVVETYNYVALGPTSTSDCLPSGFESTSSQYFSPGICPSGYTVADGCAITTTLETLTETQATCCPSSYSCNTANEYPWYATEVCTLTVARTAVLQVTTIGPDGQTTSTTSSFSEANLNAYGISIRHQSGDFSTTSSSSMTGTSNTASSSSTPTPTPTPEHRRLGVGAIAGIIIATLTVVFLLGVLVFWIRNRKLGQPQYGQTHDSLLNKYKWDPDGVEGFGGVKQNTAYEPVELDTTQHEHAYEMAGLSRAQTERHELPVGDDHDDPFRDGNEVRPDGWMRG